MTKQRPIFFDIPFYCINIPIYTPEQDKSKEDYFLFLNNDSRKRLVTLWRRDGKIADRRDWEAFQRRFSMISLERIKGIDTEWRSAMYMPIFGTTLLVRVEDGRIRFPTKEELIDFRGMFGSGISGFKSSVQVLDLYDSQSEEEEADSECQSDEETKNQSDEETKNQSDEEDNLKNENIDDIPNESESKPGLLRRVLGWFF